MGSKTAFLARKQEYKDSSFLKKAIKATDRWHLLRIIHPEQLLTFVSISAPHPHSASPIHTHFSVMMYYFHPEVIIKLISFNNAVSPQLNYIMDTSDLDLQQVGQIWHC